MSRPKVHVVYEFWLRDICMYVGVTSDLDSRLAAHRRRNHMVQSATEIRVTECETRAEADALEARLIREFQPANNVMGKAA